MSSLSVTTVPWIHDVHGKWVERDVYNRVEFAINGQGLTEQVSEANPGLELVTLFELDSLDAAAVLAGDGSAAWMPGTSRIPLLVCWCGDPHCGALTVKLTRDKSSVTWSDWAWEDYLEPPDALTLPTHVFEVTQYEEALNEGKRIASANAAPMTRVRVRAPGPWWRNLRQLAEERTDGAAMRGWLRAEPVLQGAKTPHDGYRDLLDHLATVQRLLQAPRRGHREELASQRAEAIRALTSISESQHRISLPTCTLTSVRWHLDQLQS